MPIAIGGQVYEDEVHYNASLMGIELAKEDKPVEPSTGESGRPRVYIRPPENNAPQSNVVDTGPIVEDVSQPEVIPPVINDGGEFSQGTKFGNAFVQRTEDVLKGIVPSVVKAMALPGDVLSGKVPAGSPQEIERAMDLAGLMVMGPAPVASRLADGTLGSFMGVKSKTFDNFNAGAAEEFEKQGKHIDDIWERTGTFKAADGHWKQEIPDQNATLKESAFEKNHISNDPRVGGEDNLTYTLKGRRALPANATPEEMSAYFNQKPLQLSEVLDHPELFKAYPHLNDIKVSRLPEYLEKKGTIGQMDPRTNTLYLKGDLDPGFTKSVILHEAQHAIQEFEGFAKGGNRQMFKSPSLAKAETFFNEVKTKTEDELMKTHGWSSNDLKQRKNSIRNENFFGDSTSSLDLFKNKHPDEYKRLKDIVASEDILKQEAEKQMDQYTRLMGEVEARNVQARMNYKDRDRRYTPPDITESVPRDKQINNRVSGASNSEVKPPQLPDGYFDKVPIDTRLSKSGTEPSHPGFRWEVYDPQSGKVMRKDIMSRSGASRTQDNLDNKYGGYRYRVRMVKAKDMTENEIKFLKDNDINLD